MRAAGARSQLRHYRDIIIETFKTDTADRYPQPPDDEYAPTVMRMPRGYDFLASAANDSATAKDPVFRNRIPFARVGMRVAVFERARGEAEALHAAVEDELVEGSKLQTGSRFLTPENDDENRDRP